MSKIERLTSAQTAQFPRYVAEWLGHGLSTEPADRPRAEAAIKTMYAQAGLAEPRIVWADSPLAGALTVAILRQGCNASVADSFSNSVWDSVSDSVRDSVWASVRDSVRDSVSDSVWDSVWASVSNSVSNSVRASVADSVWASVRDSVSNGVWGQHDAHWLAFFRFFYDECGLRDQTKALGGLWGLSQSCGWIFPYRDLCVATERHSVCTLDENGVIHNETGPAIAYPDGFAVYGWHGVRVPGEWIEQRQTLDPAVVLSADDVEQRAAGAQIIGWDRIARHPKMNYRVVEGDPQSDMGALVEMTLPGLRQPGRFLQAVCPRNGTIIEGVPRESDVDGSAINTALAAQAWRMGQAVSDYQHPPFRT